MCKIYPARFSASSVDPVSAPSSTNCQMPYRYPILSSQASARAPVRRVWSLYVLDLRSILGSKVVGQQSALAFGLMGRHKYPVIAMLGRVRPCASLPLIADH